MKFSKYYIYKHNVFIQYISQSYYIWEYSEQTHLVGASRKECVEGQGKRKRRAEKSEKAMCSFTRK